jgi:hypothetical protein
MPPESASHSESQSASVSQFESQWVSALRFESPKVWLKK